MSLPSTNGLILDDLVNHTNKSLSGEHFLLLVMQQFFLG